MIMHRVRAYITMAILFILQLTCSDLFTIAGSTPHLLLVFCVCFAVMNVLSIDGFILCAISGFLCDITGVFPWGVSSLIFMAVYVGCSLVGSKFYSAKLPICMLFTFIVSFLYESCGYLALVIAGTDIGYGIAIVRLILPVCVYQVILSVVLYGIMHRVLALVSYGDSDLN